MKKNLPKEVENIVNSISFKFFERYKSKVTLEDLQQEAKEAAIMAMRTFDETKNVTLESYLKTCVKNKLINYVNRKSHIRKKVKSLEDQEVENLSQDFWEELHDIILARNIISFVNSSKDILTDEEINIFNLRINGFSYKEIASKIGRNEKFVDNTLQKIKRIVLYRFKL